MFKTILTIIAVAAMSVLSAAEKPKVIFADEFTRADAGKVGNGWKSEGYRTGVLRDGAAFFDLDDGAFSPRIEHVFALQKKGKFTVSFRMDWLREDEGNWGFFMQLGNSKEIPKKLSADSDLDDGIAVNLLWGGGDQVGYGEAGEFGYVKDGDFKKLAVVNERDVAESISEKLIVTIDVDLDTNTYSVTLKGTAYPKLPFDNAGPIDTIRFMAHMCSDTGFSKSSIDDVSISKQK